MGGMNAAKAAAAKQIAAMMLHLVAGRQPRTTANPVLVI